MADVPESLVVLLTDFGLKDPYVGIVKGVILSRNPGAKIVDLCHGVSPQDIRSGAFILSSAYRYFPLGTIFLAVVDPGVGSRRRAIVAQAGGYLFVAPDNGILTGVLQEDEGAICWEISDQSLFLHPVSTTFHARDIFAPAAAQLALGRRPEGLGPVVSDPVKIHWPKVRVEGGRITGEVIVVDRFGNLITNIHSKDLPPGPVRVEIMGEIVSLVHTYSDVGPRELLALVGSAGYLEISANMASAAELLKAGVSTPVMVCSAS